MLNDAALTVAGTAVKNAITHLSLHSANPGTTGTNQVGARVAATGAVDSDGDITWSSVAFTGLPANGPVTHVGYWSAATGGTFYGASALTGDTTANAAGQYTVATLTETNTAT